MRFLLDVSVVIALIDPAHIHSDVAHQWFVAEGRWNWATCPIVENGALRIMSQPRYSNPQGSPTIVAAALTTFFSSPGRTFWADDISLLDSRLVLADRLTSHERVTDSYLLALAVKNGGRFATLDRRLTPDAVVGGREALVLL